MSGFENIMGLQHENEGILNCPSSDWDLLVSLSQVQTFGGSPMVSHSEFANSSYPLVQYISDSNVEDTVPNIPSYGSSSFLEMVGSFGQPGSDDVANTRITGKAVMLDEIINYVQSLQQQVEFLSMKLATVNPELNLNVVEGILSKDILQSRIRHRPIGGYGPSFQGTLAGMPNTSTQFPPLPRTVLDHSFYGMSYDSSTADDNLACPMDR